MTEPLPLQLNKLPTGDALSHAEKDKSACTVAYTITPRTSSTMLRFVLLALLFAAATAQQVAPCRCGAFVTTDGGELMLYELPPVEVHSCDQNNPCQPAASRSSKCCLEAATWTSSLPPTRLLARCCARRWPSTANTCTPTQSSATAPGSGPATKPYNGVLGRQLLRWVLNQQLLLQVLDQELLLRVFDQIILQVLNQQQLLRVLDQELLLWVLGRQLLWRDLGRQPSRRSSAHQVLRWGFHASPVLHLTESSYTVIYKYNCR
ncbi:hypothetical protein C7M84_022161 [Penaeus vannamei]|uniref:Uncharacterized protein n=1 Tax=Penaeus vannamei TaxID=6689 RepID=A0A3R7MSB3_PENVA|nr:hypothetical protein C7M84_022161 [Penaeus vannamei]